MCILFILIIFLHNYSLAIIKNTCAIVDLCFSFHCPYWSIFSPIWSIFNPILCKKTLLPLSKEGRKVTPTSTNFFGKKNIPQIGGRGTRKNLQHSMGSLKSYYLCLFSLYPCLQILSIVIVLWLSNIAIDPAAKQF